MDASAEPDTPGSITASLASAPQPTPAAGPAAPPPPASPQSDEHADVLRRAQDLLSGAQQQLLSILHHPDAAATWPADPGHLQRRAGSKLRASCSRSSASSVTSRRRHAPASAAPTPRVAQPTSSALAAMPRHPRTRLPAIRCGPAATALSSSASAVSSGNGVPSSPPPAVRQAPGGRPGVAHSRTSLAELLRPSTVLEIQPDLSHLLPGVCITLRVSCKPDGAIAAPPPGPQQSPRASPAHPLPHGSPPHRQPPPGGVWRLPAPAITHVNPLFGAPRDGCEGQRGRALGSTTASPRPHSLAHSPLLALDGQAAEHIVTAAQQAREELAAAMAAFAFNLSARLGAAGQADDRCIITSPAASPRRDAAGPPPRSSCPLSPEREGGAQAAARRGRRSVTAPASPPTSSRPGTNAPGTPAGILHVTRALHGLLHELNAKAVSPRAFVSKLGQQHEGLGGGAAAGLLMAPRRRVDVAP